MADDAERSRDAEASRVNDSSRGEDPSRESDASGTYGDGRLPTAPPAGTTGYGITLTLIGAVLLALSYYGVVATAGARQLGQAIPEPFYYLAIAALFVVELLRSGALGVVAIGRALALAAVYGALFVLAVEGGAYLWENPEAALEGFEGVTVFAVALVAAALLYVGYLTVLQAERA